MKYAFNQNGILQDVVMTNPQILFPKNYASLFIEVPDDAENGWLWNGETATPPLPNFTSPSPQSVTPRQARLVLALTPSGDENFPTMLAKVEAAFASLPEPDKTVAQITWEYSTEVQRNNPLIAQMQAVIGFTNEQIDQLFIQAATL